MVGFLGLAYPWVKAAHLIFVIFWTAGMFMLPRYAIYQAESAPGSAEDAAWTKRCASLRRIILTPAMIAVWLLGLALMLDIGALSMGWFHAKLALVLALSGYHGWAVGVSKKLARGWRPGGTGKLRLLNEVPALAAILIVVLVIVKPF